MTVERFHLFLALLALLAVVIFMVLFFIPAPYGRHAKKGWGPGVNNRVAWLLMEAPASLLFFLYYFSGHGVAEPVKVVFLVMWQSHYVHRAFIYPLRLEKGSPMPLSIVIFGMLFNAVNTFIQGYWLFHLAPAELYGTDWLGEPLFVAGVLVFIAGYAVNKWADAVLRRLRGPGKEKYSVPTGGLYRYISCPNYFGEIVTWIGWALATWSPAGAVFALWTMANLAPRAFRNHAWYRETFPDYPSERKALIPFIA